MLGGFSSKNGPVSFEFPSTPPPPRTSKDWKCVLMEIKRLYQRRLYKQCAARCETILHNANKENVGAIFVTRRTRSFHLMLTDPLVQIHPIYRAFLTFYAAVSYEFLGRAAHLYSANKIKLLSLALEKFVDCGAALPPLVALPRLSKREDDYSDLSSPSSPSAAECLATFEPPSPRRNSLVAGITRLIDASLIEMDDPFLGIEDGMDEKFSILSSLDFQPFEDQPILSQSKVSSTVKDPMKKESMKPFPLRVIKSSNENHSCTTIMPRKSIPNDANCGITRSNSRFRPPRLPLQVITSFQLNARKQKETCVSTASDSSSPTYTAHLSSTEHSFLETPNTTPPSQTSSKETFPFPVDDLTPARAAQIVRSNHGLAFLREQINSSIYEIEIQTHHITRIQELRRERKLQRASSFWSFDPIIGDYEDMELVMDPEPIMNEFGNLVLIETKQQRIVRLRAEGWETVGLRSRGSTWKGSRYYQELCAMVMTELNLDS
ncbi:hypothetical protein N7478_007756 [Penicillium angulare]|uniref:uncharacterized protein n=1 Tax=Penicillium angulare TaxID=116970 RepID=UPI0025400DFA|nr:uncharacterized protein N7478_007756 [Penicillium angulare]KAJ5272631.1 hypothetical protein N7478_007756 [Penicillium angulare]